MSKSTISTTLNREDMRKLERRAARIGMTATKAARIIYTKGATFFLSLLVGATNAPKC